MRPAQERLFDVAPQVVARPPAAALAPADLHGGADDLARMLADRVAAGDALNAFLLAAGLSQLAEDRLEADVLRLGDVVRVLDGTPAARGGAVLGALASALSAGRRAVRPSLRRLARWERELRELIDALADAVAAGALAPAQREALAERAEALAAELPASRAFRAAAIRLPSCFRGFDQHPDDIRALAARVAERTDDAEATVVAVGLRTSGSYMAPLLAAMLRARGQQALAITARPERPLPRHKRRALRAAGLVAITDDPPASGGSIASVARVVERLGAPVLLALALFGHDLPPALERWPAVILPWEEWSVHARLLPAAVRASLAALWPDRDVTEVRRVPLVATRLRGHVAARYRVEVDGAAVEDVYVRGAGLGYFGEHALEVERRLGDRVPELYGILDGLAFRRWLPEERRLRRIDGPTAARIALYAAERRRALPVEADPTPGFAGQDPVWEVAATVLSGAFGRGWRVARVAGLDAALKRLLFARRASVVDGATGLRHWFAGEGGALVKVAPDQRAFSNRNLACYDAAYDVAAAGAGDHEAGERLRAAFAAATGEDIDAERWLLYELVALWADRRDGAASREAAERASSRALQRYFARLYLADRAPAATGAICALDVDGVLETDTLGFPSLSPAGALALRALLAHGYRPVLATGRSIGEVRERCHAYGLPGGVAEYGCAIYETASGRVRSLVGADDAVTLTALRDALAGLDGVRVGDDHRHAVRAWRVDPAGRRHGLTSQQVEAVLPAAVREHVRVVRGEGQTDFVPAAVNKATGLRALLGETPLALAVGDAVEDIPMLALAQLGRAPANADRAMRASGHQQTTRPYQAGLAQAVGELIGHEPGACPLCAAPDDAPGRDAVLGTLAARERGPAHMAWRALRVVAGARRGG